MADRVGQQLGNYRIIRPIGSGGFAEVYLGEHIYLNTQVAIKLLQLRLANEDIEGFLGEARTIAHLVIPWVALYQYSNFGGRELCFEGTGLINLADFGFDKQTQAINIAANGVFFDQPNGQGAQLGFYYADEKADLGNWDNRISSFRVDG